MAIQALTISGIRNLEKVQLEFSPAINLFYGNNGAGKTSLLEAIYMVGMARSFQNNRTRSLINHGAEAAEISAQLSDQRRINISRGKDGSQQVHLAGEKVSTVARLVTALPIQLIHAESFALLQGAPTQRRQFLDWGAFHEDAGFHEVWQSFKKSLKNRNALLRTGRPSDSEVRSWNQLLTVAAERIDELRKNYLAGLIPLFHQLLSEVLVLPQLRTHYYRGWDKDRPLAEVLAEQYGRDRKLGYTHAGSHRADLRFKIDNRPATNELSRGQQKLIVAVLKIAQSLYLQQQTKRSSVFLIDDLPSELDQAHIRKFAKLLQNLTSQVVITAIDRASLQAFNNSSLPVRMFHVEHGRIKPITLREQPNE